jgi:hypothetical protein
MLPNEIRYTLRAVARRPLYASLTALVLALAIGANTTVFSVFNSFFLRPLPYPDDDRLVFVYSSYPRMGVENAGTSIPDYLDRREQAPSLEELALMAPARRALEVDGPPEQLELARVSPSFLDVLRVEPLLGRNFLEEEAIPGNERVILLSHRLWRTRFGSRADMPGRRGQAAETLADLGMLDCADGIAHVGPAGFF